MNIQKTDFEGLLVVQPKIFKDDRGYFFESFNQKVLSKAGLKINFIQDNQSHSSYGVIRGLHYQLNPHAQSKFIRVLKGEILDVVVDIRKGSETFGKSFSIQLSDTNFTQLFIPKGFAHGFSVLSDEATILYKCDEFYNKESEAGIRYDDKSLNINWEIPFNKAIVSEKDTLLPSFDDAIMNFD